MNTYRNTNVLSTNQIQPGTRSSNHSSATFGNGRSQPPKNSVVATGGDDDHVRVFGEEEQRETHAAVLGVKPAGQLLLRLGQIERRAVGFGEPADEQDHEGHRLEEREPDLIALYCASTIPTMLSVPAVTTTLTSIIVTAIS